MCGLSHGLREVEVYHPDTPHLMSASRLFLEGTYFFRMNNRDYDGYPYFYSHVVEYLWRGTRAVSSLFSHLLFGAERSREGLSMERLKIGLFWLGRLTNVALSTLTILIVYRIAARNLDLVAGLIAAGLLAISPTNIAAAHYATNDAMVVFFTTLAVLFALRIYTAGLWLDYLLGGVLIACAFSAKYHGGIVGLTCLLGHILRYWPPKKALTREALSRVALLAVAFFIVFLLANPSLLVSPGKAFHDFRQYCRYIPTAKLTPSQMEWGFFARTRFSFARNFPVLFRSLGPIISVIAFAGLVHAFFRGKRFVVLASFPAFYLLLTFLSKPIQQRFYVAALLPTLFLLAAAFLVHVARIRKIKVPATAAVAGLLLAATFLLLKSSLTEVFYFSHRDTRRCAREWATDNISVHCEVKSGAYTFSLDRPQRAPSSYRGSVFTSSSLHPAERPEGSFLLKAFELEDDALPTFRNPGIEIRTLPSPLLSEGFDLPAYQRIPSRSRSEFIFANGATFYRDEKMVEFGDGRPASRILVCGERTEGAVVIVRNGSLPGSARIRLGGVRKTFFLDPCETKWKEFRGLRRSFPGARSRHLYKLSASGSVPAATVLVALTPEEKGVALYNIGEYAAACGHLLRAWRENDSPVLAAMACISEKLSLSPPTADQEKSLLEKVSFFDSDLSPQTIGSALGISLDYLDSLPYLSFKPHKESSEGFHSESSIAASEDTAATLDREPPAGGVWQTGTPSMILEPGCYVATLRVRCEPSPDADAAVTVCLVERARKATLAEKEFPVRSLPDSYADIHFPFEKPAEVGECWVVIRSPRYVPLFVDRIEVRPNPLESLLALKRLLKIVSSAPEAPAQVGPLDYKPLLLLGQHHLDRGQHRQALAYYLLAHQLRPDLAEPIHRIRRIEAIASDLTPEDKAGIERVLSQAKTRTDAVEIGEASVVFDNGMTLTGYAMNRGPFRPGGKIALSLHWSVPRTERIPKQLVVWVHLLDRGGKKLLQLDHYLREDVRFPQQPERIVPLLRQEAQIPPETPPGTYRIELGLWIPLRDWRARIGATALPHTRYSVSLRDIAIEPGQ